MEINYKVIILSILFVIFIISFHKKLALFIISSQNSLWKFRFGKKTIKYTQILLIFMSVIFLIFVLFIEFFVRN